MPKTNFIRKRSNRIAIYIFILIPIFLIILTITLFVPIIDDPPIYHYPYMVYLPISLSFNFLLFLISGIILRKNEGSFKRKSDNWGILTILLQKIQWEENLTGWRKILKLLSAIVLTIAIAGFFVIGIVYPIDLVSPLNMLFLPLVFGMLALWISIGVKKENIGIAVVLLFLICIFMGVIITAFIIGQDIRIIPFAISYQIVAIILVIIRLISYLIVERKR